MALDFVLKVYHDLRTPWHICNTWSPSFTAKPIFFAYATPFSLPTWIKPIVKSITHNQTHQTPPALVEATYNFSPPQNPSNESITIIIHHKPSLNTSTESTISTHMLNPLQPNPSNVDDASISAKFQLQRIQSFNLHWN